MVGCGLRGIVACSVRRWGNGIRQNRRVGLGVSEEVLCRRRMVVCIISRRWGSDVIHSGRLGMASNNTCVRCS
jgi:hypothetical protein